MPDRTERVREVAAQCIALARMSRDPKARAELVAMAQELHQLASRPAFDLEPVVQQFNDEQMSRH
jgi:hypothetical protein